jgi:hypothetical protein
MLVEKRFATCSRNLSDPLTIELRETKIGKISGKTAFRFLADGQNYTRPAAFFGIKKRVQAP